MQADSDPANPPTGMVSLWQQNLIGVLAEKYEWWGRAREQAVVVITNVEWSTTAPAPVTQPIETGATLHARQSPAGAPRRT